MTPEKLSKLPPGWTSDEPEEITELMLDWMRRGAADAITIGFHAYCPNRRGVEVRAVGKEHRVLRFEIGSLAPADQFLSREARELYATLRALGFVRVEAVDDSTSASINLIPN